METKQKRTKVKLSVLALVVLSLCVNGLAGKAYCQSVTLEDLPQIIRDLPDDVLSDQLKNSLVSKVNNALKSFDKEKDEAAINILGAFINEVVAQRGKKISEEVADMLIGYANNLIAQIKVFDLEILFTNETGICIAANDATTFIFEAMEFKDSYLIYAEEYWGEYPLYFPGTDAFIVVGVTYTGSADQVNASIVTEAYSMNTDGSNGVPVKDPTTVNFTALKDVTKTIDASFTLPMIPKGLYRFVVKIYHEGTLTMTKEGIFCPPDIAQ